LQVPHVEKHPPGNFCWIELATTDHSAAKEFYSELFGWTIREFPMGPNDCDEVATKAKCLGAKLYMPPMKIEDIGRMAVMADPQGAAFAIFEAARQ
jgi:uncharacterized protein